MKSRPYLVIAHRPSTTRRASLVADLKCGCVIERRSHDYLLLKDGACARPCVPQFRDLAPTQCSIA
jgi:ABC-type multidrug transport system fused ATPase/permease subunit